MKQCRHIPEEILVQILSCLPRKARCRFKCVSKQWCNLLSDRNLIIPTTTNAALVFQCLPYRRSSTSSTVFLHLDNSGGASVDQSIRYNKRGYNMNKKFRICDSRNGFLLLCNRFVEDKQMYLVYNPITKFLQRVVPPTPTSQNFDGAGLVFGGNNFKVIFYSGSAIESRFVFDVYSLEDKKWRRKELESPQGHACQSFSSHVQPLFFKSAMHWPLDKHLLIYQIRDEFCKLIELPSVDDGRYLENQHIWAFEGRLHCCRISDRRINIWVLYMEEQDYVASSQQCFKWQHKHNGVLPLLPDYFHYSPFAFNDEFEFLYVLFDGVVISYIPETREAKVAYVCPKDGNNLFQHGGFPFLYVSD